MSDEAKLAAPLKVKITKCSFVAGWYKDKIGEVFEVDNAAKPKDYILWEDYINKKPTQRHIKQEDCERITNEEPPPPPAQESELWRDLVDTVTNGFDDENLTDKLTAKYRLSLKSEQPEAVEFGDFLKMYASIEHTGKMLWWDKIQGSSRYYSTEQLYQLFKQKK